MANQTTIKQTFANTILRNEHEHPTPYWRIKNN